MCIFLLIRDSKNKAGQGGRGGGSGYGYGRGRGGGRYNCDSANNENNSGYNRESAPAGQGAFKDAPPKRHFSGGDGDGRPFERRGYVTYFIMNPTRLAFICSTLCRHFRRDPLSARPFEGLKFIDVGCGGGILSETVSITLTFLLPYKSIL
ncbi:putative methyltransferase [Rosa chinensis]|uniref:Putative methyltransferase n=1 Tax=Rosa chinensis TaxID=74649 RepID=A0A2P6R242_ROSCH|nr:putative methyltransferase [Rosa chinensis]